MLKRYVSSLSTVTLLLKVVPVSLEVPSSFPVGDDESIPVPSVSTIRFVSPPASQTANSVVLSSLGRTICCPAA